MDDDERAGFFITGWYVFDNFAPFQVEWNGKVWPTSEHAYQAAHCLNTDPELSELIRKQMSPRYAADLANENSDKDDSKWAQNKLTIIESICRAKLEQHAFIQETLRATGARTIVEMNENDGFWGWGHDQQGENHLGKIWMKLRDELGEAK